MLSKSFAFNVASLAESQPGQRTRVSTVGLARLELATSPLSGVRSNHLSYRPAGWVVIGVRTEGRDARTAPMLAFSKSDIGP